MKNPKGRRKKPNSCGHVCKREGGSTPCPQLNRCFFLKEEKDAECSETKKYVFGWISGYLKNFSL